MDMPIYELKISDKINDDAEVSFIALVDQPAIKRDFLAFADAIKVDDQVQVKAGMEHDYYHKGLRMTVIEIKGDACSVKIPDGQIYKWYLMEELQKLSDTIMMHKFEVVSEDQHIITGPLMVPDQLIYRASEKFGEHYVKFSGQTIQQIAIKFSKKGFQKNVNIMHDSKLEVAGVTMFESFISNAKRGIKPMAAFADLPDGTWFGSFYVENPQVWELIKSGKVKGFSVEGMFDYNQPATENEKMLAEIAAILSKVK